MKDKMQENNRFTLLHYLRDDERKLQYYLDILSRCLTAYEVARDVVRPMFVNDDMDMEDALKEICKRRFYVPIAALASEKMKGKGRQVDSSTLYYRINRNKSKWEKEREAKMEAASRDYIDVQIRRLPEGGTNVHLHIPAEQMPEELKRMLREIIGLGYASMKEKLMKHFDGRGEMYVLDVGGSLWLMPDVLNLLEAYAPDVRLCYQSANVKRQNLTVSEVSGMVEAEMAEYEQ